MESPSHIFQNHLDTSCALCSGITLLEQGSGVTCPPMILSNMIHSVCKVVSTPGVGCESGAFRSLSLVTVHTVLSLAQDWTALHRSPWQTRRKRRGCGRWEMLSAATWLTCCSS